MTALRGAQTAARYDQLTPARFLSLLVHSERSLEIGTWVLRSAISQIAEWRRLFNPELLLGVNIFAEQLGGDGLSSMVIEAVKQTGLPPSALQVELRERDMRNGESRRVVQRLSELGVGRCVDQFGMEPSSLELLPGWPVDAVKIVGSLVRRALTSPVDADRVDGIISLAREVGITTIAAGVETVEQLVILRGSGCHACQGFAVAKPLTAKETEVFLSTAEKD